MPDPQWHLPVIYGSDTPLWRPLFDRSLRAAIVFGIEWSSLSLIEGAPQYVKVATLVIAILVLAVLESRYFLMLKGRWYFSAFLAGLILIYIGIIVFAVATSNEIAPDRTASHAQEVARKATAAKETAEHTLEAANQQINTLQSQLNAANQKLASLQNPSTAPASTSTFAQTYRLTDPQIKQLRDEVSAIKSSLSTSINMEMMPKDSNSRELGLQIQRAFDLAGANPSEFQTGHPTSKDDVGVMIRVRDQQDIPDAAKKIATAIKNVTGVEPKFIYSSRGLAPGDFDVFVGPKPND